MRYSKRSKRRTGAVITAIISVPVIAVGAINSSEVFNRIAKQATVISAGMTFGGGGNSAEVNQNTPVSQTVIEPQQEQQSNPAEPVNTSFDESKIVSVGSLWSMDLAPEEVETPVADSDKNVQQIPQNSGKSASELAKLLPYPSSLETKSGTIKQMSYAKYTGSNIINLAAGQVRNCTSVPNATLVAESKKLPDFKIATNGEPQVLIMHTHTTESYEPYDRNFYDASFNSRTTDVTKSVIAVGDAIEAELNAAGIAVIHDETIHDYPSYTGSYDRSRVTVQEILKKYPSIKVVLDVHRDAIQNTEGVRTAPVATINGKKAAQIMIISGCDDGTFNMPNYLKNFRLSSLLQKQLEGDYKGLTRPVLFDYRKYNQDLTTGSILLEMGGHGNSIDQAIYSGQLMGKALAKTLLKLK